MPKEPEVISLAEVLKEMDRVEDGNPVPFSLRYYKVKKQRNGITKGERREFDHVILKPAKGKRSGNFRRIYIPGKKQPWDTVYIRWITRFNGKLVHY